MAKILRNTSGSSVELIQFGITIGAGVSYTVTPEEYLKLALPTVVSELTTLINAGTIVVNTGSADITVLADAINFLKYPDFANNIAFNNSTNGFLAKTVQAAIEESKNTLTVYSATATTDVTRTANTFASITDMNLTPPAGTYLAIWSSEVMMSNLNGRGEVAIFVGGTQQTALTHAIEVEIALLLGLLGTAIIEEGASNISGLVTCNGSQVVQIGIRSVDGQTITVGRRSFILVRVS